MGRILVRGLGAYALCVPALVRASLLDHQQAKRRNRSDSGHLQAYDARRRIEPCGSERHTVVRETLRCRQLGAVERRKSVDVGPNDGVTPASDASVIPRPTAHRAVDPRGVVFGSYMRTALPLVFAAVFPPAYNRGHGREPDKR